jgi:hypothetical protein
VRADTASLRNKVIEKLPAVRSCHAHHVTDNPPFGQLFLELPVDLAFERQADGEDGTGIVGPHKQIAVQIQAILSAMEHHLRLQ